MLTEQFIAAVATARNSAALDNVARLTWRALAENCLAESEAGAISEAVQARRASLKGYAALSLPKPPSARRRPVSPDRKASIERRRRVAASGAVPSFLAHHFTPGETAALSVVAGEVRRRGRCEFCIDKIAALAGTCRTVIQNALRQARRLSLVNVVERRHAGRKSDTNVVEIISPDWLTWLRLVVDSVQGKKSLVYQELSSWRLPSVRGIIVHERGATCRTNATNEKRSPWLRSRTGSPSLNATSPGS
jgi:hypothetical protein